jgi:endonuclease III
MNELVFILLSKQTTESNYLRVYRTLRREFPSWANVARADPSHLEEVLRPAGLAVKRAREMQGILERVRADFGGYTLDPLRGMSDADIEAYLRSLPGIGLKSAWCVMVYALDREVFPVDAHVWRLSRRLGWVETENSKPADNVARALQDAVPPQLRLPLHVRLVAHGRAVCGARRRECDLCPLRSRCRGGD